MKLIYPDNTTINDSHPGNAGPTGFKGETPAQEQDRLAYGMLQLIIPDSVSFRFVEIDLVILVSFHLLCLLIFSMIVTSSLSPVHFLILNCILLSLKGT